MATPANIPALLALVLGLFYMAAAIGELRRPGQWRKMIEEIATSQLGQLLGGAAALAIGALLIALVPMRAEDWLNLWLFGLGCIALLEGVTVLIMPDKMTLISRLIMRHGSRPVALITLLLGVAFCLAGIMRL